MKESRLMYTNSPADALRELVAEFDTRGGVFVIADENTTRIVDAIPVIADVPRSVIQSGDSNKTIAELSHVWQQMSTCGLTRHSLVVNVGGGVVTDLGGMAAATFKRGVPFVNLPTTLLGAVDAAVGGKTGVNINNLKNEIGIFAPADAVVISTCFFATLPTDELLSGYGEMLKHGLLKGEAEFNRLLGFDVLSAEPDKLLEIVKESVEVKRSIVAADPAEQGLRKALNLGHTAGHAIESMMLDRGAGVAHGRAVAWGMLVAMILSHTRLGFPSSLIHRYTAYLKMTYGTPSISCRDYDRLVELMRHDKKNVGRGQVAFTLLRQPGEVVTGCVVAENEIRSALDLFQDLMG